MGRHCYDPNLSNYQLSACVSHTADYPESNGPPQQYLLFLSPLSFGDVDLPCCLGSHGHLRHHAFLILITLPVIPTLLPLVIIAASCCHPSSTHCHTPAASHVNPSSRHLHPPCKVSLQPINELAGLVLKWEALLQLNISPTYRGHPVRLRMSNSMRWMRHFALLDTSCPTQLSVPMFSFHNISPFLFPDLFS